MKHWILVGFNTVSPLYILGAFESQKEAIDYIWGQHKKHFVNDFVELSCFSKNKELSTISLIKDGLWIHPSRTENQEM